MGAVLIVFFRGYYIIIDPIVDNYQDNVHKIFDLF